jgi:signal transduction histidine kinase
MTMASEELIRLVHDLRTPLTIVEGFSDLLARKGEELALTERDEYLGRIVEAAREMRALLDRAVTGAP